MWTIDDDTVATLRPALPASVAAAQRVHPTFPTEFDSEFVHFFKNVQIIGGLVVYLVYAP
jgi:hypothetical protein